MNPNNFRIGNAWGAAIMVAIGKQNESFSRMDFPRTTVFSDMEYPFTDYDQIEYSYAISFDMGISNSVIRITAVYEVGYWRRNEV